MRTPRTVLAAAASSALLAGSLLTAPASAAAPSAGLAAVPAAVPAAAVSAAAVSTAAVSTAAATRCAAPFTTAFARSLARDFPGQRVTASVYDTRTGCWYSLNPRLRLTTASVIKAAVLGAVLLRAQDRHRGLTAWERQRSGPMMSYSYNNPYVSDLLGRVGGVRGMDAFDRRVGATQTTSTLAYGATWTTSRDRTKIARAMLHRGGPLGASARAEAWRHMTSVTLTQRWGITAGVPAGWRVGLKNGFYPMRGYGWRVGSTGFVTRHDRDSGYAITVLTDKNVNQVAGIRLVERVSRRVAASLLAGPAKPRVVERARCVTTRSGQSWRSVAARVGVPSSRRALVRKVSGGNPSPLSGQRACSPVLRDA